MNAEIAEREGRMPITRAIDAVYRNYNWRRHGITRKAVRELLERHWDGEWHHVGPYAHEVGYFDTRLSFGQLRQLLKSGAERLVDAEPALRSQPLDDARKAPMLKGVYHG
jgi:hypothetical protein